MVKEIPQKYCLFSLSVYLVDNYQPGTNSKLLTTSMNTINTNDEMISIKAQRELGIIEKLCSTYGFVYCCHRDGRYFFHFSEYKNDIHQAKIGGKERNEFSMRWTFCFSK
jgi:hypothetical protein